MVDLLGAGTGTFARVTGAFFIGLSLGAWCGGATRPGSPWLAVAAAEAAVMISCIATLLVATSQVGAEMAVTIPGMMWILPACLIVPASFAMGITFPWIVLAADSVGGRTVLLYAINTTGAVIGVVGAMTVLLPTLGLVTSAWVLIGINALVAAGAWGGASIWRATRRGGASLSKSADDRLDPGLAGIAFGSGFLVLSFEVTMQHQFSQILINSLFSSAAVLAFVLTMLAAAAALAPALSRVCGGAVRVLPWAIAFAVIGVALQPVFLVWERDGLRFLPYDLPLPEYLWSIAWTAAISSGAAVFFSGLVFPLAVQAGGGGARATGRLLACNGLGGLAGAELTSLVFGPVFGLWQTMILCACGYLVMVTFFSRASRIIAVGLAAIVAAMALITAELPVANLQTGEKLVSARTAPEGIVCVVQRNDDDLRILFNNTYTLGGSKAQTNQERQALIPLLLHGNPRSVATLGVATGSTLAGTLMLPGVESVTAIELSPTVAEYARIYFATLNRKAFDDLRVEVVIGDARHVISNSSDDYDVVIGDLFLPWRTGEGRMFSVEHFKNVKRALKPDGIFCQWLPLYQLTEPQFETIVRTFLAVFPDAFLVRGDFYKSQPIVGMVGGVPMERINWSAVESQATILREAGITADPLVRHADGIQILVVGNPPAPGRGPLNTLRNAWLEWNAGRNIIGMQQPWFSGSIAENYLRAINPQAVAPPISDTLRNDPGADWSTWPGRL